MKKILQLIFVSLFIFPSAFGQYAPAVNWSFVVPGTEDGPGSLSTWNNYIDHFKNDYLSVGQWEHEGVTHGDVLLTKFTEDGNVYSEKKYGGTRAEAGYSFCEDTDGGIVVLGSSCSNDGYILNHHGSTSKPDAWVFKVDSGNNIVWNNSYGGSEAEEGSKIIAADDGGFYIMGSSTSSDGDVSANHGGGDLWMVKINNMGSIEWEKCYGGSNSDLGYSMIITSDNNLMVVGETNSNDGDVAGNHGYDLWMIKISFTGDLLWQKCLGGSSIDWAKSIRQTADGGFIMCGTTGSNNFDVSGNHGSNDIWLVKTDAFGNIEWQKCFGDTYSDYGSDVRIDDDGSFLIGGYSRIYSENSGEVTGVHGMWDGWIARVDKEGNLLWSKSVGGSYDDVVFSIVQSSDGGVIASGYTHSDDWDIPDYDDSNASWNFKLFSECSIQSVSEFAGTIDTMALSVSLSDQASNAVEWHWTFGDGTEDFTQNPTHTYQAPGYYDICLEVKEGCSSDFSCKSFNFFAVGIEAMEIISNFEMYPNPLLTSSLIAFNLSKLNTLSIEVCDLQGRKVKAVANGVFPAGKHTIEINRSEFGPGIYYLQLITENATIVKKLVVQ